MIAFSSSVKNEKKISNVELFFFVLFTQNAFRIQIIKIPNNQLKSFLYIFARKENNNKENKPPASV